jgi:hypothetical protein
MKSAYEIALERLAEQGVEPPSRETLSDEIREAMEAARTKAEAALAEMEILHHDRLKKILDPSERAEEEQRYLEERSRIEARRDREIESLRGDGATAK